MSSGSEFQQVLTATWVKVLDPSPARRFLRMAPATTFYDAYWSTDGRLNGTTNTGGFPLQAGEDFSNQEDAVPQGAIYMKSAAGETVSIIEKS